MQSAVPRTVRQLYRNVAQLKCTPRRTLGARWNSSFDNEEPQYQWSTPLAKQLAEAIKTTGPIPVASFMRQCLTSDLGGYYTPAKSSSHDQFGVKGDFVTSPEISQIFGELVGIWVVAEWIAQGRKSTGIQLMEVGPGRGTLMDDMLRTIRNFPSLGKAIEAIYLVETSANLRQAQHQLLCGNNELKSTDMGYESVSRHSPDLKIIWCEDVRFISKDANQTPFIIAHEFFDALPIHVFQSVPPSAQEKDDDKINTPTGPIQVASRKALREHRWREMLVSNTPPHRLEEGEPEFELSISQAATPHSMYLPETSQRYQALKNTSGAIIEISPESQAHARDFAVRIGGTGSSTPTSNSKKATTQPIEALLKHEPSGAALIIDYGPPSNIPINSLRGIRSHRPVSPFFAAGTTDVSADVDFRALAETAILSSPGVEVHGPVDQGRFLTAMGIQERAAQLVKRAVDKDRGDAGRKDRTELSELVKRIEGGWRRLVDQSPQGMGRLYQVMAVVPHVPTAPGAAGEPAPARRRPVGFGGDVTI